MEMKDCYRNTTMVKFFGNEAEVDHLTSALFSIFNMYKKTVTITEMCDMVHLGRYFQYDVELKELGYIGNIESNIDDETNVEIIISSQHQIDTAIWDFICSKYNSIKYYYESDDDEHKKFYTNSWEYSCKSKYVLFEDNENIDSFYDDDDVFYKYGKLFKTKIESIDDIYKAIHKLNNQGKNYVLYERELKNDISVHKIMNYSLNE